MSVLCDYARAGIFLCLKNGNLWANGQLLPDEVAALTEQRAELVRMLQAEPRSPSPDLLQFALASTDMITVAYTNSDDVSTAFFVDTTEDIHHFIKQKNWPEVRKACVKIVRKFHPVEAIWRAI